MSYRHSSLITGQESQFYGPLLKDTPKAIFAISENDRQLIIQRTNSNSSITVLPIPIRSKNLYTFHKKTDILFVGLMSWKPNAEAFWWLVKDIMPLVTNIIPEANLHVIGSNPTIQMRQVEDRNPNIHVYGFVPNIEPFFKKASVFVAPIKSGSGVRIKILTALSYGVPVTSTKIGSEGLNIRKASLITKSDPSHIAKGIVKLLTKPKFASDLSAKGLDYIKTYHDPKQVKIIISSVLP